MSVRSLAVLLTIAAGLFITLPTAGAETPTDATDTVELRLKPLPDGVKKIRKQLDIPVRVE